MAGVDQQDNTSQRNSQGTTISFEYDSDEETERSLNERRTERGRKRVRRPELDKASVRKRRRNTVRSIPCLKLTS